jgi:hypothetical protein
MKGGPSKKYLSTFLWYDKDLADNDASSKSPLFTDTCVQHSSIVPFIRCRGNVITVTLPSNERKANIYAASTNERQKGYKKNGVSWDVPSCGSCKNPCFGGTWRLHHQSDKKRWIKMMEALSFSEKSVLTRATGRNITEDEFLHCHRRENLKPYTDGIQTQITGWSELSVKYGGVVGSAVMAHVPTCRDL